MGGAQSSLSEDDLGPYEYKNVYRSQDMTFVRIVLNDQNKHLALKAIGRLEVCHLVHVRGSYISVPLFFLRVYELEDFTNAYYLLYFVGLVSRWLPGAHRV
jgi:hypothetical protein